MANDQNPFLSPEAERLGRQTISQRGMTLEDVMWASSASAAPDELRMYPVEPVYAGFTRQSYDDRPVRQKSTREHEDARMIPVYLVYIPICEDDSHENS